MAPVTIGLCTCDVPTRSAGGTIVNVTKTESLAMCIADSSSAGAALTSRVPLSPRAVKVASPALLADTSDAAAPDDGGAATSDFGATLNGSAGDDDDCKYGVSWTSSPIFENTDVTFTVSVKELASTPALAPLTGGDVTLEVFLTDTHPADTSRVTSVESPAGSGTYKVGPMRFDAPGKWTVRFHFNELCDDTADDSPHGHAAFFVEVP